jgi:hypothetical protein
MNDTLQRRELRSFTYLGGFMPDQVQAEKSKGPTYQEVASVATALTDDGKLSSAWIREKLTKPPKSYDSKALSALKGELDKFADDWNETHGA